MILSEIEKIYIIGCGGTGSWLSSPLCRFLNASKYTGQIWFIDGDSYDENNFDRQEFSAALFGENKAECQALMMGRRFEQLKDNLYFFEDYLGPSNINLIEDNCIVFNCVDNHFARAMVDRHISTLKNAVHICSGNQKTDGQIQYHVRKNGSSVTRPIHIQFPGILEDKTGDRSAMSCEELSLLPSGGQFIITNYLASALMLAYFTSLLNLGHKNLFPCDTVLFDLNFVNFHREGIKELVL